jgi:hypothetical protein
VKLASIAAIYSILIGIAMIGMWTVLLGTGQVPEIDTEPIYLSYHLIAEFGTAAALLIGGFGLFTNRKWGLKAYLVSMGMLLYAVLIAGGYYAQKGEWPMIGMFTIFIVLTAIFLALLLSRSDRFKPRE